MLPPPPHHVSRWDFRVTSFEARGVSAHGFVVAGDEAAIQGYYDRHFSRPSGGRVDLRAVVPYVLLLFSTTERLYGADHTYPDIGPETELLVLTFARDASRGQAFVMVAPYLAVDNPLALVQGREVFGLAKDMGYFTFSPGGLGPAASDRLAVEVLGVERINPGAPSVFCRQPLLEVRRATVATAHRGGAGEGPGGSVGGLHAGARSLARLVGELVQNVALLPSIFAAGWSRTFRVVVLKQFHDVADSLQACYQGIIGADTTLTHLDGFGLLTSRHELVVQDLATHPLGRDLGLRGRRPVELSFWWRYDFTQRAKVLWEAS